MDECGNVQVEESGPLPERSSTVSGVHNDNMSPNGSAGSDSVSMPICFLVREQAKSLVAIQDLQKRIQHLECVQGDVISAITDVHGYLSVSGGNESTVYSTSSPKSNVSPSSQDHSHLLTTRRTSSLLSPLSENAKFSRASLSASYSPRQDVWKKDSECEVILHKSLDGIRAKDSHPPESEGKDSGLDSDCRDHAQECPLPRIPQNLMRCSPCISVQQDSDELSCLLDEISEKSQILRSQVSPKDENSQVSSPNLGIEVTKLHLEQLGLHHLLSDIKGERDNLQAKIENLESTTQQLSADKTNLEHRFISALVEKHNLENKLQRYNWDGCRNSASTNSSSNDSGGSSTLDRTTSSHNNNNREGLCKVNGKVVSSILKETNVVDLQKEVLTYMMQNEVLHTKLEQTENLLAKKEMEKQCIERASAEEIQCLMNENEQLRLGFEEVKIENVSLRSKVRMLERVLQSVTQENQDLNLQLGESILGFRESNSHQHAFGLQRLSSSSGGHVAYTTSRKRLSLPAQHDNAPDITVSCAKAKFLPNTSSFLDVTLEDARDRDDNLDATLDSPLPFKASTPQSVHGSTNFNCLTRSSQISSSSSASAAQYASHRRPYKRLTFNAVKTNTQSNHLESHRSVDIRHRKNSEPLDLIQETSSRSDLHKFPFQSILEKLKTNAEYKLPTRSPACVRVTAHHSDNSNGDVSQSLTNKKSFEANKCNNSSCDLSEPDDTSQTKDTRSSQPKTLHKRIQNILDRMKAESEEGVV